MPFPETFTTIINKKCKIQALQAQRAPISFGGGTVSNRALPPSGWLFPKKWQGFLLKRLLT
jgi:hypothetical protein